MRGGVVSPGEWWQLSRQEYCSDAENYDEAEDDPGEAAPDLGGGEASVGDVQEAADCQHGHALLLGQHGQSGQKRRGQAPSVAVVDSQSHWKGIFSWTEPQVLLSFTQSEEGGQHVSPADNPGHRLSVDRQDREDETGEIPQPRLGRHGADQADEEESDQAVQQHVGQVEVVRVGSSEAPVEFEGETGERSVGLVRPGVGEGDPPVVRLQQGGERGVRSDQGVVQDTRSSDREFISIISDIRDYKSARTFHEIDFIK